MPRTPAAKKARQENLLKHRLPYKKPEISDSVAETPTSDSSNLKLHPSPTMQDETSEPEERTPLSEKQSNHIRNLHNSNEAKRKLAKANKKAISAQNKLARSKRGNKPQESSDSESDVPLDADDDFAQVDTVDNDVDQDHMNFPESQNYNFIPVQNAESPESSLGSSAKNPENLSRSGLFKRKKAHQESVKEDLGPQFRITDSPPGQMSVEAALRWKTVNKITDEAYADLPRYLVPCLTVLKKFRNELLEKLRKEAGDGLATAVINYLNSLDSFDLENVRVNIGADKGSDTTKIVWYLVDLENPLSPDKLHIYTCYVGDESRKDIKTHMDVINEAIFLLQSGSFETKHGLKTFTCFWISDCKMADESVGLQGGSANCPCVYCTVASKDWKDLKHIPDSSLRTIEDIQAAGEIIEQAEASQNLTSKQLSDKKREQNSVKATPMLTAIPLLRFVPPCLHILTSGVCSIVKYCKDKGSDKIMLEEIEKIKVKTHQGTSDYTGGNCRKILAHFVENPEINGFGIDLLRSFAGVQKFALARDLTENEINELDNAIKAYFDLIDKDFSDLPGKKTKFHILRFHVMPFVRAFKSWGKFSEQSLEHLHHVKNDADKRCPGKTEAVKAKQLKYFTDQQLLRVYFATV